MIQVFDGKIPQISDEAFVAENASIIGDVKIGRGSSIWFGAALRGDEGSIEIGERSNVQDNATVHSETKIGNGVTVGHNAIVHGCKIEDNVLVGMGAIILDGAHIGEASIVGAGALVTGNKTFPPRSLILGSPAKLVRELSDEEVLSNIKNAEEYVSLAGKYSAK